MKSASHNPMPEFSRPLSVDKIPVGGIEQTLDAKPAERKALAERFGLLDLPLLHAEMSIKPTRAGRLFEAKGRMTADVVQQCVVTLEPLPAHIEEEIEILYAAPEWMEADSLTGQVDLEDEEIETVKNGVIDLGELIVQELGTALDPYPRKPGIAYVDAEYGDKAEAPNPFAELVKFSKKDESKDR